MNKTYMTKKGDIKRDWHVYDMDGKVLGRAVSEISKILMGKNKPTYTPHMDEGDYVVVINSDKLVVTGKKLTDKLYHRHSGFPGGYRNESLQELMEKDSTRVIEYAVKGMLPKNKLQAPRLKRLKVYKNSDHPHANHFEVKKETKEK